MVRRAYLQARYPESPVEKIRPFTQQQRSTQTDTITEINSLKTFHEKITDMVYSSKGISQPSTEQKPGQLFDFYA